MFFLVSLFFQAVLMISILTVIFLLVTVLYVVIFNLFDFLLATYFTGFINRQYFIRQVVFVRLSYGVSVELFVVLFLIFCRY